MSVSIIAAVGRNRAIGVDGGLPWRLSSDLKRFKALTMGKPMIMGRRTFESFPAPLPGRRHIVLTRDSGWRRAAAEVALSPDEALRLTGDEAMVIGGAEVFALFLDRADRIELTEVHCAAEGDVTVPRFTGWREIAREDHAAEGERPPYSFVTLVR